MTDSHKEAAALSAAVADTTITDDHELQSPPATNTAATGSPTSEDQYQSAETVREENGILTEGACPTIITRTTYTTLAGLFAIVLGITMMFVGQTSRRVVLDSGAFFGEKDNHEDYGTSFDFNLQLLECWKWITLGLAAIVQRGLLASRPVQGYGPLDRGTPAMVVSSSSAVKKTAEWARESFKRGCAKTEQYLRLFFTAPVLFVAIFLGNFEVALNGMANKTMLLLLFTLTMLLVCTTEHSRRYQKKMPTAAFVAVLFGFVMLDAAYTRVLQVILHTMSWWKAIALAIQMICNLVYVLMDRCGPRCRVSSRAFVTCQDILILAMTVPLSTYIFQTGT